MDVSIDAVVSSDDNSPPRAAPKGIKRQRRDTGATVDVPDDSNGVRHQCPHCDRSFGRVEHMKRHVASHSNQKPYRCASCNKGFHRLDTMQRHELIHRDQNESSKPKGSRACVECASAKIRCTGGHPCSRCETKTVQCIYPDARNRVPEPASPPPPPQESPTNQLFKARSQSISYSPAMWSEAPISAISPPWLSTTSAPLDIPLVRHDTHDLAAEHPTPHRHLSFGSSVTRPGPATAVEAFHGIRPGEYVNPPADAMSPLGSTTRSWLETLLGPPSVNPQDAASPETVSHKTSAISETYLDGDGARLPKIGIRRRYNLRPPLAIPEPGTISLAGCTFTTYSFPAAFCQSNPDMHIPENPRLDEATYEAIRRNFEHTCSRSSSFSPSFEDLEYPTWAYFHSFIQIYLDEFQPLMPMLHIPTLDLSNTHWLLALALASMGCHFADMPEAEYCALALNEHLRRAINDIMETSPVMMEPVLFAQVRLLNCIGMIYCGDERMERAGWRQHSDLIKFCKTHWMNEDEVDLPMNAHTLAESELQWLRWRDIESRRRTGYSIWLADCMWFYGYQERNLLILEDATVPVPCPEVMWETESALQWQHVKQYSVPMPSLHDATNSIYIEKRVEPTMGEFSRILLLHALYSASWSIQAHLSNPLHHWIPRAGKQELRSIAAFQEPIFLPAEPSYFRWRNATCDSLDILHWRANSVTGASSGVEHPTLLHLHLARIILLTPYREICTLASGLTGIAMNVTATPPTPAAVAASRALVRRWAEQDQPKARLAMYHAGVLFWHVRLYSAKGAYEPTAVLLAALALWAFGTFAPPQDGPTPQADEAFPFPTSINIDRPADDEIVQMYIRRGDRMQALIVGVGDIRSPLGPQRVLNEGAKLVSSLANWGSSRRVMSMLVTLARVTKELGVL